MAAKWFNSLDTISSILTCCVFTRFFFANARFINWIWRNMSWKNRGGCSFEIYFTRLCQCWVSVFIGWKLILKEYSDFYGFFFVFTSFLWPRFTDITRIEQYAKLEKNICWKQWILHQNRFKSIMALFLRVEN